LVPWRGAGARSRRGRSSSNPALAPLIPAPVRYSIARAADLGAPGSAGEQGCGRGTGSGAAATRLLGGGEGWKGRWQRGGRELRGSGRRVPAAVDGEREVKAGVGGES
jgi:hypothetical protein